MRTSLTPPPVPVGTPLAREKSNGNGHHGTGRTQNGPPPSNVPGSVPPRRGPGGNGYGGNGYGGNGYGGYGYGGYGYGAASGQPGDFRRVWHAFLEKSWLVALTTVTAVAAGFAYLHYTPVQYSATATIQAEQDQPNILKMQMVQLRDLQAVDYLQTVAQTLNSLPLLERVADTNDLWTDPRLVQPHNQRQRSPIYLLSIDDIKNATELIQKLSNPAADPISIYLWNRFSPGAQKQILSPSASADQKRIVLAQALNQAIQNPELADQAGSSKVKWSAETQALLVRKPSGAEATHLNRLLLQDVYASELAKPGRSQVLGSLQKMVKVKLRKGTRLIDITVTHNSPELTELIANSIVREYVNESAEREDTAIGKANKSLSKEAERLRKKLEESENALQAYKEETKAGSLDERQNTVVARLKELSTKATEAKSARIRSESEQQQALSLGSNIDALLTLPSIAKDATVLSLQLNLTKAEDDFAALCKRYKEEHPKYIQAKTQIGELKSDITNAVLNAVQVLRAGLESAKAAEEALHDAMQAQEASALELSKLSIRYSVLAREVESDRALYDAVLKGLKEASVTKETQQTGVIRVVQPAYIPDLPIWPKKSAVLAASGLLGLFFGVLMIMAWRVSDTSIRTVDEAERLLGLSVLSAVPQMKQVKGTGGALIVEELSKSEGAEAFRTLRASLTTLGDVQNHRVYLFTSAMPSEGKTFCSINFAASLAQIGHKTLLIDADLRRPAVELGLVGQETKTPGLADCLLGTKTVADVIRSTPVDGLSFVSGGATAPNPAELLAKGGMEELISKALEDYDRVVIDSAPVNAVSDTLLMLKQVQTVCLVVHATRTSSRYVQRCVQLLQGAAAPLSGVILNKMPRHRRAGADAYYDYNYHGKYGKAGVYGAA